MKKASPAKIGLGPGFEALAAFAVVACLSGCATVTSEGARSGKSAAEMSLEAASIEGAVSSLQPLFAGKNFSMVLQATDREDDRSTLEYAGSILRETGVKAGGRYVGESGGDLRVELFSAEPGSRATERNFILPLSNFVRIPVLYSESLLGESGIVVVIRDRDGNPVPIGFPPGANRRGEGDYYLFRIIPFHR